MYRRRLDFVSGLLLALALCGGLSGDDFRIESDVYFGIETTPRSENVTLFRGGQVYDFMSEPFEIAVFDKTRARVILLDRRRKLRAEIETAKLTAFGDDLKTLAGKRDDPFLKFACAPNFEQTLADNGNEITFASQFLTYQIKTAKAPNAVVAQQLRDFSDATARLNAVASPGSALPPFPRLAVNEALAKAQLLPERVSLTVPARQRFGGKPLTMHSEHRFHWRLLESDQRKIDEAGELLVTFTPVPLSQYLRSATDAAARDERDK